MPAHQWVNHVETVIVWDPIPILIPIPSFQFPFQLSFQFHSHFHFLSFPIPFPFKCCNGHGVSLYTQKQPHWAWQRQCSQRQTQQIKVRYLGVGELMGVASSRPQHNNSSKSDCVQGGREPIEDDWQDREDRIKKDRWDERDWARSRLIMPGATAMMIDLSTASTQKFTNSVGPNIFLSCPDN